MSTLIQIKRTQNASLPSQTGGQLHSGELAYLYDTSNSASANNENGKRLYIGDFSNPDGAPIKVGGQYYTDMMEHAKGTLTADSAIIVDDQKKINELKVDNINLDGNAITTATGNLSLNPTGSVRVKDVYNLPTVDGTAGQVIVTDGNGTATFADVATNLGIAGDTGSDTISLLSDTLTYAGGTGVSTVVDGATNTITISGTDASTTAKGIAQFSSTDFDVAAGVVSLKSTNLEEQVEDIVANAVDGLIVTGTGLTSVYDDTAGTLTISGTDATTSAKGIASFASADFSVASGVVTIGAGAVSNAQLAGSIENTKLSNSSTTFSGDTGTTDVSLGAALAVVGGSGISSSVTAGTLTIAGDDATTTTKGVASFAAANFSVASGAVTLASSGIATANIADDAITTAKILDSNVTNAKLANSTMTLGSSTLTLGAITTDVAGITSLVVDNMNMDLNTISTTNTNGNLVLDPNGTGTVDVNSHKITSVANPTAILDAANKQYVDSVAQGLQVKAAVVAATTANIAGTYSNGAGTITPTSSVTTIDGVSINDGDRILVKDQSTAVENGVYVTSGSGSLLTRASDSTSAADLTAGQFFFIQSGTNNGDAGFVQTNIITTVGSDNIVYTQFSGAGQIIDGAAISKTGNQLDVVVDDSSIEVVADALQIKALGVTNAMLAGSIENAKLTNSSVTINGAQLALGGTLTLDTDDIAQGSTNIYYTDALARAALSITSGTGLSYDSGTGVLAGVVATTTTLGVASYSSDNFAVSGGGEVTVTTVDGGSY